MSKPDPRSRRFPRLAVAAVLGLLCAAPSSVPMADASRLTPAGTVSGQIVDCAGKGIAFLNLTLVGTELGAITDPQGQFVMSGIPTGNQVLQIARPGYGVTNLPITVGSGVTDLGRILLGCDHVKAPGNTFGTFDPTYSPESVLLLDGRLNSGSCVNDRLHTDGPAPISLFPFTDNIVAAAGTPCTSEVAVFSVGNAALYYPNPSEWSPATGDQVTLPMSPAILVELKIWLAVDPANLTSTEIKAKDQILSAIDLYDRNRAGVEFTATIVDATTGQSTIGDDCNEAIYNGLTGAAGVNWYTPGELNVYYVEQAYHSTGSPMAGVSCGQSTDPDIIFISRSSYLTTLAHEIGHAFGLRKPRGHTDWTWTVDSADPLCTQDLSPPPNGMVGCQPPCLAEWPPDTQSGIDGCQQFKKKNLMFPGVSGRTELTIGQIYQMNFDQSSQLIDNGYRTGMPAITCGPEPEDDTKCPVLWLTP